MAFSTQVRLDVLRSKANGAITSSYTAFGTAFDHRMRMIKITNATDGDMFIAFNSLTVAPASNGTADNDFIPSGGFVLYDFASNSEATGSPFVFQEGTQVWIRYSTAPTTKSVYLTCVYGRGE
jgi:hypothetical protein